MKVYHYFALFDFDETIGKTFEPNKRGVDVTQAYKIACGQIFQCPVFEQVGGLKNGTPGELVHAILNTDKKDMLMTAALDYLDRECRDNLNGHVQLKADMNTSTVITELLIRVKLRLLMAQIGTPCKDGSLWPNSCHGFTLLWRTILAFNKACSAVKIVPGIISSGHDSFIKECFKMWGLSEPPLMVTDDTMRSVACNHLSMAERVKPQVGPVRILCEQWLNQQGESMGDYDDPLSCIQGHGFYGGDNLAMDGTLARNLGLPFFWFNQDGKHPVSSEKEDGLIVKIRNWQKIVSLLLMGKKGVNMMTAGLPFA